MTPSTDAGRKLLDDEMSIRFDMALGCAAETSEEQFAAAVAAIEREAVANALSEERIAAALDRYWSDRYGDLNGSERTSNRNVAAALRAALLENPHD